MMQDFTGHVKMKKLIYCLKIVQEKDASAEIRCFVFVEVQLVDSS